MQTRLGWNGWAVEWEGVTRTYKEFVYCNRWQFTVEKMVYSKKLFNVKYVKKT